MCLSLYGYGKVMKRLSLKDDRSESRHCLYCSHFRNNPAYLEKIYKGLSSLSSAHASVRKDDGLCLQHNIYLCADNWCVNFKQAG